MRITIKLFQDLQRIMQTDINELDKALAYVAAICGIEIEQAQNLKPRKFAAACRRITDAFTKIYTERKGREIKRFRTNGQTYQIHYNPRTSPYTAGRYVEVATFSQNPIQNLHKIMASLATPVRRRWFRFLPVKDPERYPHHRIALDFLEADMATAYDAFVFFCRISTSSTQSSPGYLQTIPMTGMAEGTTDCAGIFCKPSAGFIRQPWWPTWSE